MIKFDIESLNDLLIHNPGKELEKLEMKLEL